MPSVIVSSTTDPSVGDVSFGQGNNYDTNSYCPAQSFDKVLHPTVTPATACSKTFVNHEYHMHQIQRNIFQQHHHQQQVCN